MNKKNILVLVGSLACVALLGYFTYSTVSTLMKSKSVSQEVSLNENTSSENKDKNSQNDLSERLKETDDKKEENKNNTDEKKSEKTSNSSENKSTSDKSNNSTNENKKNTSDKNTNSKETLNTDKKNNSENSKSESKNTISYSSYLKDLETEKYTLKEDEKLSDVAKKFKETCTVNSSLNIIKSLNQISNTSSLESGDTVLVPVNAFQDGKKYSVKEGDTWYSIARKHYPKYNHEVVIDFLMDINPFKNDILPLGEDIFLPNI
ncbi:LysM peptidoglycan-binding domain-containing protein [Clostridium perfringens]|uniref:LysM peptidoglycan-binding domain-containing protein n=1 Tax=Clostridium perfringens TaxID=1502 RepID=A0AAW9I457_CLOPF|nr:LysM domain-containing protein [Clostridium perfringens]MBI5983159.1 LysM peptidoglycan-binding domain-containing protein [Clostridium perfringens]MBI5994541.1 LysM peptidoglycan-binding domain-containing protein [Clostridium perfringens]MBI6011539.1 LysM peptidoglycan-binding domain-containing protein [Clostridium perfringens]MBI6027466.1 LysM peptidoglycan-binding domain-containing protein [Clostridium perfringens]MBI6041171.1 LysM peptidoglycan-binding domain-containing protein [Clostrid